MDADVDGPTIVCVLGLDADETRSLADVLAMQKVRGMIGPGLIGVLRAIVEVAPESLSRETLAEARIVRD